jgi:solute carrier family 25 oxoglutarate transporter 11
MMFSSFAGMGAATFCHPLDTIRVQMQVDSEGGAKRQYKGSFDATQKIVSREGVRRGLYAGLSAAFLRQWTYGACRMGIYSYLLNSQRSKDSKAPSLASKLGFGLVSGGIGAFIGTPSELALVRMTADSKKPLLDRRGYTSVVDCCSRIVREEGPLALWRGASITIMRACVLSSVQMGVTSEAKEHVTSWGWFQHPNGVPTLFVSTLFASVFANTFSMPFDVVKSRLQNQNPSNPLYKNAWDCAKKSIAQEGPLVMWRGFTPAFIKLAPYSVLSLMFLSKLTEFFTGHAAL